MKPIKLILSSLMLFLAFTGIISCGGSAPETISQANPDSTAVSEKEDEKLILFFGNSLTAGYGIDPEDAFPGLVQARLDSLGKEFKVINGGLG